MSRVGDLLAAASVKKERSARQEPGDAFPGARQIGFSARSSEGSGAPVQERYRALGLCDLSALARRRGEVWDRPGCLARGLARDVVVAAEGR